MHMLGVRRMAANMGIALGLLGAGLWGDVQPAGAQGMPPIIRFFGVWVETRPELAEPHLLLSVQIDDPDGEVPATIQSVIVTAPDAGTLDLTARFRYPNLGFRGEYFLDAGPPLTGIYTIAVTDTQGHTVSASKALSTAPSLLPPSVTSPENEAILTTTTPTISWEPVAGAGSTRVAIRNADGDTVFGDSLYTGPLLAGSATQFAIPAGVLTPGRRYVAEIQAHDTPGALPAANNRTVTRRPFSVAGPNVGVVLNQSVFATGQTLRFGVSVRNDGGPVNVDVQIWAGAPGGATAQVMEVADVEIPSTSPDASLVANDIVTHTFEGQEPAGAYVVGIRLRERVTGGIVAQAIGSFTFAP